MMIVALVIFMAGSLLCAVSPNIEFLTAMRVVQGFGGGGLMTLSQALIGETIPPRERGRYQGYLAGVAVSSSTFGPVAGGYLTQAFGWQSIFLVNLPLGLIAMALVFRLRRGRDRSASHHVRHAGAGVVHHVREPGDPGVGASAAYGCADAAIGTRPPGVWHPLVRPAALAGTAQHLSGSSRRMPVQAAVDLAQRRLGGLATARRWSRCLHSCRSIYARCAAPRRRRSA